jgi:tRNA threonylcarbamoyladenosine biosynthesis protein TsaE
MFPSTLWCSISIMIIASEEELLQIATTLAKVSVTPLVINLKGPLGAGKTTFSRGFMAGLGYIGKVKSPTYTLVETYHLSSVAVHHFDLYRIHDPEELELMGVRDYFNNHSICLIEWPEQGSGYLPEPDIVVSIEILAKGRSIQFFSCSTLGKKMLERFNAKINSEE